MPSQSHRAATTTREPAAPAPVSTPRSAGSARGNGYIQEALAAESAALVEQQSASPAQSQPDWLAELLAYAPTPEEGGGAWSEVIARVDSLADPGQTQADPGQMQVAPLQLPAGVKIIEGANGELRVWPGIKAGEVSAILAEAGMSLEALRPLAEKGGPRPAPAGGGEAPTSGTISAAGAADLNRLAAAASQPWYSAPRGKCYRAVAGFDSNSYMNKAGGRWKALADRIPSDHAMWAVSFAHWLQETAHGRRAAAELGFVILESDGKTRLGDFLKARPELRGAIVVTPYGQEGTASREWNAAAHYGQKWGAGVGDISVVTEIGEKGATHVADGQVRHDNATMWWIVHPK